MIDDIRKDISAIRERDPAARSNLEIFICYPGLHAVILHRISHKFYIKGYKTCARIFSQISRFFTGIEIHPAAKIGPGLFIDHGMGVVIGETAEIGSNVTIYQGATLGGTGKDVGKRHPTIGDNVVISAGAKILGPFKIGDNSKVGANSVVLKEVSEDCTVVGVPGRVVKKNNKKIELPKCDIDLDHSKSPDPLEEQLCDMLSRLVALENRITQLEKGNQDETL